MRFPFAPALVAAALAFGFAGAADAQQGYPRAVGSGENLMIDYGPGGQAALVGGGRVTTSQATGMDVSVMHLDAMFVQQPRPGFIPLTVGSGENSMTVYVPAMMMDQIRAAARR